MLKKILIACAVFLSVLLVSALVIALVYEDQVKKIIITQINKQLITPIEVGEIKFSLIRNFPHASLSFYDVKAKSIYKGEETKQCPKTLFKAGTISLQFNLKDIFYGNYTISKINVSDGNLYLFTDSKQSDNFHFWRTDTTTHKEAVSFKLSHVSVKNFTVDYTDLKRSFSTSVRIDQAKMKGEIYQENFAVIMQSKLKLNHLQLEQEQYLAQKQIELQIGLVKENKVFSFTDAEAVIEKLKLVLSGSFNKDNINFFAKGKDVDIQSFLSFLPEKTRTKFNDYSSEGKFTFDLSIKGKPNQPKVKVDFSINDARLENTESAVEVKHLMLKGYYSNGRESNMKTSGLYVTGFSAFVNQSPIEGAFTMVDFTQPFIDGKMKASLELNEMKEMLKLDTFAILQGKVNFNVSVSCSLEQLKQKDISTAKPGQLSGVMQVTGGKFQFVNDRLSYDGIEADLYADDNYLLLKNLIFTHGKSSIDLHGEISNYRVLFSDQNDKAILRAYLNSDNFELEDWLNNSPAATNKSANSQHSFLDHLDLRLKAKLAAFKFDRFVANKVNGEIYFRENKFRFDSLYFNSMDGKAAADGMIEIRKNGSFDLICDAKLSKISIDKLFQQLNNFGQNTLTNKHIAGKLSADIKYKSSWYNIERVNQESILADAEVTIIDGELNNFTPLNKLSRFVSVNELSHIKFKELVNHITISNRKISIPQFQINSSAMNLSCNGTHDFDNNIDYHFKVTLNELLSKKRKREAPRENEFNEYDDDEQGKSTLFISMTGNMENPVIKFDKKELKKFVKDEINNEKQTVKQLLKDEFGLFKNDPSLKAKMEQRPKKSGEFEVEWEEDSKQTDKSKESTDKKKPAEAKENKFFDGEKKNEKSKRKSEKVENSDDYL